MKTVWKFPLSPGDPLVIAMPAGARVLHVGVQDDDRPCIWALVDPAAPEEERSFRVHGTGQYFDGDGAYVGTAMLYRGGLVFHVFEVQL
jgi:hypothetical protein